MTYEAKQLMLEIDEYRERIAELEHQHKNDECANKQLFDEVERVNGNAAIAKTMLKAVREKAIRDAAALFQGEPRNREMYLNDIEEKILGLIDK